MLGAHKEPRPVELTGAGGGHKAHAIWLRKGEMNRLQCVGSK